MRTTVPLRVVELSVPQPPGIVNVARIVSLFDGDAGANVAGVHAVAGAETTTSVCRDTTVGGAESSSSSHATSYVYVFAASGPKSAESVTEIGGGPVTQPNRPTTVRSVVPVTDVEIRVPQPPGTANLARITSALVGANGVKIAGGLARPVVSGNATTSSMVNRAR